MDVLPDDVLLGIFDFYTKMDSPYRNKPEIESWQLLVHVCRRWRSLVFQSPRHLNLQLYCTPKTPARDILDVWPALPLIVTGKMNTALPSDTDNVVAALRQSNRVCKVILRWDLDRQMEKALAAMQVSFPELTKLQLSSYGETPPVIPDSFLDGSAPRLRIFSLCGIRFPGLPKLLLSANHLVHLRLSNIPHSGYTSPEPMVALLCALSSLEILSLVFQSLQSRLDWESGSLPLPNRSVIPALRHFHFKGGFEYLEDLVTFIDAPQLNVLYITFFNQINLDTPRLAQFINRTPTLRVRDEAHVQIDKEITSVALLARYSTLEINILCSGPRWHLSSIAQVCNSFLHPLATVETLYIENQPWQPVRMTNDIDNTPWLQLLLPFTAVKNLYLSKAFAPGIAATLQELVEGRITEVLPSLQNIFMEGLEPLGPFQESIGEFLAMRQLSDHPIAISVWNET
jgi:hypothetical protein